MASSKDTVTKVSTQSEKVAIDRAFPGDEKYGLSWTGKEKAFQLIRETAKGTLVPQPKESKDWDETGNIFIEGDNLEVLKLLQRHYRDAVKMIYIDPPYNTGKDFIYKDNFTEGLSDYYERTGQTREGIKLTANPESAGRYHSDWLTMMYPRLFLARNLLRPDGVIFVSIDDNEVANLRLIMDEIFGEENFVATLIWTKKEKASGVPPKNMILPNFEYILVYRKHEEIIFSGQERSLKSYKQDKDGRYWRTMPIQATGEQDNYFDIVDPKTGKSYHGNWAFSKEKVDELIKTGKLIFPKNGDGKPTRIVYADEMQNQTSPIFADMGMFDSELSTKDFIKLFDNQKVFDFSKPVSLIEFLITQMTRDSDIILDFFAGSGTTAHAVMAQNAEDGGDRKYILVQLPEATNEDSEAHNAGYKTIAEIARERVRRAGKKIGKGDIGFKSFELTKSNYRQWNVITNKDDETKLKEQMKLFVEKPLIDGYGEESVVYEIMIKEGFDLNATVKKEKVGKFEVWVVTSSDIQMAVTFAKKLTKEDIDVIVKNIHLTGKFVCLDNALDDTTKVNVGREINLKTI